MTPFKGFDFYLTERLLSEEEILARNTVRDFVEQRVLPIIESHNRNGTFPVELLPEIGSLGVLGATLPEEYGCAGASYVIYGLMMQELERGDSGLRSFASVQSGLVMYPIYRYGSDEQKTKWIPALATAEKIGCFGLTETDHGSDPGGMETKAVEDGDAYVLNGAKMWITNGTMADVAVVWAKLDGTVRGFLVEKGTPGFSAPEMKGKHSLRASVTSELIFQDVRIPKENLLPGTEGLKSALSCLTQARYGIAWGAVGAAMACYHSSIEYTKTRKQFDRPIASFQLVQQKLVEMATEISKAQLMNIQLGRLKDDGKATHAHVSMAKRNNVAIALDIARAARDLHGANGILDEYPIMRHMNNLESVKTYEGTHDVHTLILGHELTGIAAYT